MKNENEHKIIEWNWDRNIKYVMINEKKHIFSMFFSH